VNNAIVATPEVVIAAARVCAAFTLRGPTVRSTS